MVWVVLVGMGGLGRPFRDMVASSAGFASQDVTVLKFDITQSKLFGMSRQPRAPLVGVWPRHDK